jgi:hypothetical protein
VSVTLVHHRELKCQNIQRSYVEVVSQNIKQTNKISDAGRAASSVGAGGSPLDILIPIYVTRWQHVFLTYLQSPVALCDVLARLLFGLWRRLGNCDNKHRHGSSLGSHRHVIALRVTWVVSWRFHTYHCRESEAAVSQVFTSEMLLRRNKRTAVFYGCNHLQNQVFSLDECF